MKINKKNTSKFIISGLLAAGLGLTGIGASVDKAIALDYDSCVSEDGYPIDRPWCDYYGYPATPSRCGNPDEFLPAKNLNVNLVSLKEEINNMDDYLTEREKERIVINAFNERKKLVGYVYELCHDKNAFNLMVANEFNKIWFLSNRDYIINALNEEITAIDNYLENVDLPSFELSWLDYCMIPTTRDFKTTIVDNLVQYQELLQDEIGWVKKYIDEDNSTYFESYIERIKEKPIDKENEKEMRRSLEMYSDSNIDERIADLKNLTDGEAQLNKDIEFLGNELSNHRYLLSVLRPFLKDDENLTVQLRNNHWILPFSQKDLSCHELVGYINDKKTECQQKLDECQALMSKADSNCTIDLSSKDIYLQEKAGSSFSDSYERKNFMEGLKAEYLSNNEAMNSRNMFKEEIKKAEDLLQERIKIYNSFLQAGDAKNKEALPQEGINIFGSLQQSIDNYANETNLYYEEIDKLSDILNEKRSELKSTGLLVKIMKEELKKHSRDRHIELYYCTNLKL